MELVVVSVATLRRGLMNAILAADLGVAIADVSLSVSTAPCPPPEHDENLPGESFVAARFVWYDVQYRVIVGSAWAITDKARELIKYQVQLMINRAIRSRRLAADMLEKHRINVNAAYITSAFEVVATKDLDAGILSPWSTSGAAHQYVRIHDFVMASGTDVRMTLATGNAATGNAIMVRFTLRERRLFTQLFVSGWY